MKLFSQNFLDELTAKAGTSPRQRAHHNIHASAADLVQRFFVVARRDSYFRPHRHSTRAELAVVLRGQFDILTFDASGTVTERFRVGPGTANIGFETPPGTWHTLLVASDYSAFLVLKEGPDYPATTSEYAHR